MHILCLPVRIITGVEGATVDGEFVGKYEIVRLSVRTDPTSCALRRIVINQQLHPGKVGDLPGAVDVTQIETRPLERFVTIREVHRVYKEKGEKGENE